MVVDPLGGTWADRRRVTLPLTGVEIDVVTEDGAVELIVEAALGGRGGLVVTPNIDHLQQIFKGSWLGAVYAEADLVVADGLPLVWASQLLGMPLPERVAGSHLLTRLSAQAAENGLPVFMLGGREGAAEETARRFVQRWPKLDVTGWLCPKVGFEPERGGLARICEAVASAGPASVFTGLGAPKQDFLNVRLRRHLPDAWYLGVGGAFDMAAGHVRRAPTWAQRSGLEWAFRLVQEPGRMARRYLIDNLPFAVHLLAASAGEGRKPRAGR